MDIPPYLHTSHHGIMSALKDLKQFRKIVGDLEDRLTHLDVEQGDVSIGRVIEFLVNSR